MRLRRSAQRTLVLVAFISPSSCRTAAPAPGAPNAATSTASASVPTSNWAVTAPNPTEGSLDGAAAPSAPTLRMHGVVGHGYGCGGHCAFNSSGDSTVEIVFGTGGVATARDVGWFNRSESYPDGHVDAKRTWQFEWRGTWAGDNHRRSVKLELGAASCATTETGSRTSGPTPCAKSPPLLELDCAWGPPPAPEPWARPGGAVEAGQLTAAWVCIAPSALPSELGAELPWVFTPGAVVERRIVGEPEPVTSYSLLTPDPGRRGTIKQADSSK